MPTHISLLKKHEIYNIQHTDSFGNPRQNSTPKKTKVEALSILRLFVSEDQPRKKDEGKTLA